MPVKQQEFIIRTPARLHFTLIDLNGELGRIDGGIGVALDRPNWILKIKLSKEWSIPPLATNILKTLKSKLKISNKYEVTFKSELPIHVGLGSQTQLSLAIVHGITKLEGFDYSIPELAEIIGRGGTSGIGVAAYSHGGFILDGGHSRIDKPDFLPSHFSKAKPAVLINRIEVPSDWCFVVTIPDLGNGKYGTEEVKIFKKYCPISPEDVEKLSRIILMQLLPAIVENDLDNFGLGLTKIQNIGFKRIENQLQHKLIKELQDFYLANGAAGTGLSSFGPATFSLVRTEPVAKKLTEKTKKFLKSKDQTGTVFYTKANNTGAEIKTN
jgi:beta-ribofuranosylaminobenzene 5'-phosphate synthase